MTDSTHIVCPHCDSVNRIDQSRLGDQPKCGKCHKGLFVGHPVELGGDGFNRHIQRNDIPVLVDFWAPWCGPCKAMAPAFVEAAEVLEPRVRLAKVDTEAQQAIGAQYAIRSIPTLILYRSGREVARQSGAMSAQDIVRWTMAQIE